MVCHYCMNLMLSWTLSHLGLSLSLCWPNLILRAIICSSPQVQHPTYPCFLIQTEPHPIFPLPLALPPPWVSWSLWPAYRTTGATVATLAVLTCRSQNPYLHPPTLGVLVGSQAGSKLLLVVQPAIFSFLWTCLPKIVVWAMVLGFHITTLVRTTISIPCNNLSAYL